MGNDLGPLVLTADLARCAGCTDEEIALAAAGVPQPVKAGWPVLGFVTWVVSSPMPKIVPGDAAGGRFKAGDKVMCVDASPLREDTKTAIAHTLEAGRIYTVRSIHVEPGIEGYGVRLAELVNPDFLWSDGTLREWSYNSNRFERAPNRCAFGQVVGIESRWSGDAFLSDKAPAPGAVFVTVYVPGGVSAVVGSAVVLSVFDEVSHDSRS